jgi:hypothetical protein
VLPFSHFLSLGMWNHLCLSDSFPSPEDGNIQFSERRVFLLFRIPDDGQIPRNPVILCVMHLGIFWYHFFVITVR